VLTSSLDVVSRAQNRLNDSVRTLRPFLRETEILLEVPSLGDKDGFDIELPIRYAFREAAEMMCSKDVDQQGKPLVIFFHGLGCSKFDFVGALHRLPFADVLVFDWPFTGILKPAHFRQDSALLEALNNLGLSFDFDLMVRFAHAAIHSILRELGRPGKQRFTLVGHSMGAKVAVLYASRHREDVQCLVNVEGHLHPSDPKMAHKLVKDLEATLEDAMSQKAPRPAPDAKRRRIATDAKSKLIEDTFEQLQKSFLEGTPDSDAIAKWMHAMERMTLPCGFYAQAKAIAIEGAEKPDRLWQEFVELGRRNRDDALCRKPLKLLYIYGERNRAALSTSKGIYELAHRADGIDIRITEIAASGHFPFFDNPKDFWTTLEGWLQEVLRRE